MLERVPSRKMLISFLIGVAAGAVVGVVAGYISLTLDYNEIYSGRTAPNPDWVQRMYILGEIEFGAIGASIGGIAGAVFGAFRSWRARTSIT